ncbi:S41 family peptidase [Rubricoccus marinus]|uniref:Tricorn protease homolog n=1 Tax=Rubricoccus marinus TaxID=716817 RepID=A0A259U1C4_9BACT|nr:S41 family peptidase [Rubricoccus marinus]OZC03825.1 protease [Rubricoccus marinus]
MPRLAFRLPLLLAALCLVLASGASAQETLLLRQPTMSATHVAFAHGGDLWIVDRAGGDARRLTSTPAVEADPHFSPDGQTLAFTSNRSGVDAVYTVPASGGDPTRLTWYPASSGARGWTRDGQRVLYASSRETAPTGYDRLWTVAASGGPSTVLPAPWGTDGSYAPDGERVIVDRVARWDSEWRAYRGGQNTPLTILDLGTLAESEIPNTERTTDIQPVWMGDTIYFLSDRDWTSNVWAYTPASGAIRQVTRFTGSDVKTMGAGPDALIIERDGRLHTVDPASGDVTTLRISARGDMPWAATRWEDVSDDIEDVSLSATGQRVLASARGDVFTIPVENGDARNLTRSSGDADRAPIWSPDGTQIAWFSDTASGARTARGGAGYALMIGGQDGLGTPRRIEIGESAMAWEPTWSPDGEHIAFADDKTHVRMVHVESGDVRTVGVGGTNIERGEMGLTWSPDSNWLAYSKSGANNFRSIMAWSAASGETLTLTDPLADAYAPAWDRSGRHLYFLASTDLALGSGWANTSAITSDAEYAAYVIVLRADDPTPFFPQSDEEPEPEEDAEEEAAEDDAPEADDDASGEDEAPEDEMEVLIDIERIGRRTVALPMPEASYALTLAGPEGTVFIGAFPPEGRGLTLHKFDLKEREATEFVSGVRQVAISADAQKMVLNTGGWKVVGTGGPSAGGGESFSPQLQTELDRQAEWKQMFDEAWRYQRDYFYDDNMHGRDWDEVYARYAPLVPHIRHRADLNYVLDQMNGELSVGHSFVFGGDMPETDQPRVGLLGADLEPARGRWRIARIYTTESWNPGLDAPLDRSGLEIEEGHFLVGVNGREITAADDPYRFLDGTSGVQTVLHVNSEPTMEGAWRETVTPVRSENGLRQRAWVEDNRRRVDELSGGKLGYVWVPNTGGPGFVSFNRYYFAQQDKQGAVIDERFNGGGLLDDYMVDLMTRRLRAAVTNEAPGGAHLRLPAGILGPKVLLINELAGSGGDFFPWVFRQQNAGPLIGTRTWGGLVKSSVHYALVDGGALTAPDNAVFDPINNAWIGENEGIAPDIEVRLDARSVASGGDPQLERAVQEALRLLEEEGTPEVVPPTYSTPARQPRRR